MSTSNNIWTPPADAQPVDAWTPPLDSKEVKKKDLSFEDFQTSMEGVSKAPVISGSTKSKSEAPSTSTDIKEEKPIEESPIESKILSDVNKWYESRGGLTPQQKLDAFSRIATQKKSQYEQNIQSNPDKADELLMEYDANIDNLAYEYGLLKKDDSFTVSENDINLYKERVNESFDKYVKDLEKSSKNDPFISKVSKRLSAGSDRFLNIPTNVMAISEAITNAISEKLGGGENTYWQDRAFYLSEKATQKSQEAKVGEGDIVSALQTGDVGEAVGNLVLDVSEQIPQLITLWTGNAAGVTNASLGLIGAQVGTDKFVQNKELGIPDWLNAINSITSAGIEVTFENIGTVKILDNIKRTIKARGADVAKDELSLIFRTPLEKAYATVTGGIKDGVRESATEVATELANQVVDKYSINPDIKIGEGLGDIAVTSFVIGNGLRTLGEVSSPENNKAFRDAYEQVPDDYTAANKVDAAKLIMEIEDVESKTKGKNKLLTAQYKEKLNGLNDKLLKIAEVQDQASLMTDQINELDKDIVLAEEEGQDTEQLEKKQDNLIKQRDDLLNTKIAEEVLKKEQQPKYSIDGIEYTSKEEFLKDVDKFSTKDKSPDIKVENDDATTKQVADMLEKKLQGVTLETPDAIKTDETTEAIPEQKQELKKPEIEPLEKGGKDAIQERETKEMDVRQQASDGKEVVEGIQEQKVTKDEAVEQKKITDKEIFRNDFLSDKVNLNNIDVPLKMKDREAARQNLIEGKKTKQAEILEDYINKSFDHGSMDLVAIAAGGKSVRTSAPLESIIKQGAPVVEEKPIKVKSIKVKPLEVSEAKTRIRGVEQNIFQETQSEQQKFVQTLVDANKESYDVLSYKEATENAKKYIAEKGSIEQAYDDLTNKTGKLEDLATRQVARLSLMDYYSRKAINPNVSEQQQDDAVSKLINLEKSVAREATGAGQASAVLNIWKAKQPESVLKIELKKIKEYNRQKLDTKIEGKTTIKEQIGKVAETIDIESKKIANDIIVKNSKYLKYKQQVSNVKREAPKKRQVAKEKIKKEQDYRKERIEKYKKERGKTFSAAVLPGLTQDDIEFAGDMIASYIREGYYRVADITQKLKSEFKNIGINLTDDQLKQILSEEKDGKKVEITLREQEAKFDIPASAKEFGNRIDDIIKKHWTEKADIGISLTDKFIEEAGLTTLEANELANIVLSEYNKQIKERSDVELTKLLGRSILPREKTKRKNVVDRLLEATNLGALDTEFYTELFGEYFGLQKLTPEQSKKILEYADKLQKLKGTGIFETEVAREMAGYIHELYPKSKTSEFINLWMDMAYASLLSGVSTSVLNMTSAGSNIILKPVRDALNISKWIDTIRKHNTEDAKAIYNPFGELVYVPALSGMRFGVKESAKVFKEGGIDNKYIDQISSNKSFKVGELERPKYGEGKRFKPITVKVGNKKFDINIFNAYKYSGRNLLAQDRFMYSTIHDITMATVIADKFAKTGLKGNALNKAVIAELTGQNIDQNQLINRLENDITLYTELTGKQVSKLDRDIRRREIMLDMLELTDAERAEIEQIARSNIFTDDRGGLIAHVAYGIGKLANTNPVSMTVIKPFVPFTKIVGNVTEYMMDHIPIYGQFRALGWSPTSIYKKVTGTDMLTSQMGERGSQLYYEQMGRAWLGTTSFLLAMMLGLGGDDEDYIQITGGRNKEGFKKQGRQNVVPNYTLRIGDVMIPYLNIPSLAVPLGLIGNINDALQLDMSEGDIKDRLTASMLLTGSYNTITMTKDMSVVQGISALTSLITDVLTADENRWNKIGEEIAKRYLGFASKPLPQNVNLVRQIEKFFDPTSYSRKDIKEIIAYTAGVEHFINNPSIDQLGDVVETYPGETLMPYTHWLGLKGGDSRWKFLSKYNAIPTKIFNTQKIIETTDGMEKRRLDSDEFYEYTTLAGKKFSNEVLRYMGKDNLDELNKQKVYDRVRDEDITKIQDDLNSLRSKSNADAFTELFRWGVAKKENPKAFDKAKKYSMVKPYTSSKKITINDKAHYLDNVELYKFNTLATLYYLKKIDTLSDKQIKELQDITYTDENGITKTALDVATDAIWSESKQYVNDNELGKVLNLELLIKE